MSARYLLSIGTATCAVAMATPALAQAEMSYEQKPYLYAQPAPQQLPVQPPVVYQQNPVVQPIPVQHSQPVSYPAEEYEYNEYERAPQPYSEPQPQPQPYHAQQQHPHHAAPMAYPQQPMHQQMPQQGYDRAAWMEECQARVGGGYERRDRNGNIIGGLVGAAAGGLLGNRIAGRGDRLGGSLIGAGVGGLAGLAVGSAIDSANERGRDRDSLAYCEDWFARYSNGYGYQQQAAYQYAQPMMLVPVMVQVPQRAVVREYVTEEVVHVDVVTYEDVPARRRVIHSAPRPDKRIPVKRQRTKYVKGN